MVINDNLACVYDSIVDELLPGDAKSEQNRIAEAYRKEVIGIDTFLLAANINNLYFLFLTAFKQFASITINNNFEEFALFAIYSVNTKLQL
jgi:hypothetical protein